MGIFLFHLTAKPIPGNPDTQGVGGAFVNLWAKAESQALGKMAAEAYLAKFGWIPMEWEIEMEPTQAEIDRLGQDERANYETCRAHGVSAFFGAWPVKERPGDISSELRLLTPSAFVMKPKSDA